MSNCVKCTDVGAEGAINGNRYVCPNCRASNKDYSKHFKLDAPEAFTRAERYKARHENAGAQVRVIPTLSGVTVLATYNY
jgi:2-hydroxychromene-2-carboxylate isomerase